MTYFLIGFGVVFVVVNYILTLYRLENAKPLSDADLVKMSKEQKLVAMEYLNQHSDPLTREMLQELYAEYTKNKEMAALAESQRMACADVLDTGERSND